jgi:cysteine-rich repeat protein
LDASSADGGYSLSPSEPGVDAATESLPDASPDAANPDAASPAAPIALDATVVADPIEAGVVIDGTVAVDAAVAPVQFDAAAPPLVIEAGPPAPVELPDGATAPIVAQCEAVGDCDDGNLCNGAEGCTNGHCVSGRNADDGQQCELAEAELDLVCSLGSCTPSECGDGFLDERTGEQCDDANDIGSDGCEVDCTFTCAHDDECSDGELCNGDEHCELDTHTCKGGEDLPDQTPCGDAAECYGARCLPADCGDGVLSSTESCDDNNLEDGDGCDADCTYSCLEDADCHDGDVCNGTEFCDVETHACIRVEPLSCDDANNCTQNTCYPVTGCHYPTLDQDGDGEASAELGACGTDCDDGNPAVHTGAGELCDGLDNNCNGKVDETATT